MAWGGEGYGWGGWRGEWWAPAYACQLASWLVERAQQCGTAGCTAHMAALYRMYITVGLKAHTRPLVRASSAAAGGRGAGLEEKEGGEAAATVQAAA